MTLKEVSRFSACEFTFINVLVLLSFISYFLLRRGLYLLADIHSLQQYNTLIYECYGMQQFDVIKP